MSESVTTERDLDADPADVWEAISEPERLGEWLDADVDVEISEGSEGTIVFGDDVSDPSVVLIETVDEGERLVFRWATAIEAPTEVSIEIEPISTGTRVRVVERVIPHGTASRHGASARACASAHASVTAIASARAFASVR